MGLLTDQTLLSFALINTVLALSVYVTFGSGLFALANGGFMAIGAYVVANLANQTDMSSFLRTVFGILVAVVIGFIVALPFLRLRGIYLALLTFGFGEVIYVLALNLRGITNGQFGMTVPRSIENRGIAIWVIVAVLFVWRLRTSRFGRAADAIRQEEAVAEAMGIPVRRYTLSAFLISAGLAALAGGLWAQHTYFISPNDFGFTLILDLLLFVVIGGMHYWYGSVLGAFILTYLIEILNPLNAYRPVVLGVILTTTVVMYPRGLGGLVEAAFLKYRRRAQVTLDPVNDSDLHMSNESRTTI